MSRLQAFLIRCGIVAALALGITYLINTNDPKEFERAGAYEQETLQATREDFKRGQRLKNIYTKTKTQLAETAK